ncbi:MAG: TolC family protein [Chitinivibrionales bacterium]|nr:TolC family protein [Chitinivibrionales bacterium]
MALTAFFLFNGDVLCQSDSALRGYIQAALNDNLQLQASWEMVNSAAAETRQSLAALLPHFSVSSRATRNGQEQNVPMPWGTLLNPLYKALSIPVQLSDQTLPLVKKNDFDTRFELTQVVFSAPAYHNYRMQHINNTAAEKEYAGKRLSVAWLVYDAYYAYAKALQLHMVRSRSVRVAQEQQKIVLKMHQVDKSTRSELLRAQVALSVSIQEEENSRSMVELSRAAFNTYLNRDLDSEILIDSFDIALLASDTAHFPSVPITLEQALDSAFRTRIELQQFKSSVESIDEGRKALAGRYLPTLAFVGDYGFKDERLRFTEDNDYWALSAVIECDLYDGGQVRAKLAQLESQRKSVVKAYEQTIAMIRLEVKNSYTGLTNAIAGLRIAMNTYGVAAENYRIVRKRFEEGMEPLINLIDSQTAYDNAQTNCVVTYYTILGSSGALAKSMGHLYD